MRFVDVRKNLLLGLIIVCFSTCMDTYNVNVKGFEDLLVVDALLTNENKSHVVKIGRSMSNLGEIPQPEENATVVIASQDGTEEVLTEVSAGVYETDSTKFIAKIGGKYKLKIVTEKGNKYESNECSLLPPTQIQNIIYKKSQFINVADEEIEGIRFFVDGEATEDSFLRWIYEEDWKFLVSFPTCVGFDENEELINVPVKNVYCWKNSKSSSIVVQSLRNQNSSSIKEKDICFVQSGINDRFNIRYSIVIKQLTISEIEYNFWNKLKESTEEVGDLFGSQPFAISGNIKNVDNENEPVLGYFQTGSVSSKRIFISNEDASKLGLKKVKYSPDCLLDTVFIDGQKYKNLYSIYDDRVLNGNLALHDVTIGRDGLILAEPTCNDCSLTGSLKKPKFWEDK